MSFRFDRFVTLYLVDPPRAGCVCVTSRPFRFSCTTASATRTKQGCSPYYRTATTPPNVCSAYEASRRQRIQDDQRSRRGEALAEWIGHKEICASSRSMMATAISYRHAFPVLERTFLSATVFLPTAYIGDESDPVQRKRLPDLGEVRELRQHGILFGSHTVTHPQLRELSCAAVKEEINLEENDRGKAGLRRRLLCLSLRIPSSGHGFYETCCVIRSVRPVTGMASVQSWAGRAAKSEPFFMERLPVNTCDDGALFPAKLAGAYDWVAKSQYASKVVKACLRGSSIWRLKPRVPKDFPAVQGRLGNRPCPPETCSR